MYEEPKNQLRRDHNKETLALAEAIKAKKVLAAQSSQHGFVSNVMGKVSFLEYFEQLTEKKHESEGNYGNWLSAYRHLVTLCSGKDLTMNQVDDLFLERFKEYLLTCKARRGNKERVVETNNGIKPILERIEQHEWKRKIIPSGFFNLPESENVSCVLFSNNATITTFNRMGKVGRIRIK